MPDVVYGWNFIMQSLLCLRRMFRMNISCNTPANNIQGLSSQHTDDICDIFA